MTGLIVWLSLLLVGSWVWLFFRRTPRTPCDRGVLSVVQDGPHRGKVVVIVIDAPFRVVHLVGAQDRPISARMLGLPGPEPDVASAGAQETDIA